MLDQKGNAAVKWFWSPEDFTESKTALGPSEHFKMSHNGEIKNGVLTIMNVQPEDSGVYYCQLNVSWGPGTQLQVFRRVNTAEAVRRSNLKDAMILIQGLLLGAIIVPVLLHLKEAKEKEDAIYEEPEDDHTYEGLEIEHCGLYEDIPALCEPSEAAWEKTETPLEE
ncbi:hypothetical protein JZ751_026562 [Albula glossodonta]|uniref:Ig-like domain-containing protein n=1 Tax=Albula glossodonta TaxID=121402 RepID=A0A8T2PDC5_9TELE|nr:hypothetical protein JZ751_026562 [Albula glossodonta]